MGRTMPAVVRLLATTAVALALVGCGGLGAPADNGASIVGSGLGKQTIERQLDLRNMGAVWSYDRGFDAWTLTPLTAVANPEMADEQGVSVCVPGAYVKGVDTTGDGEVDVTAEVAGGTAQGTLVVDFTGEVTSSNGQSYTAATAPVIVITGAEDYTEQKNHTASPAYAAEGYVSVACGNRGKQSTGEGSDGQTHYTGDAPSCLVDQKGAVRFVKYNILLGNLPGSVDHFVAAGASGGGAHAVMLAATSNNADFFPYEAALGAVGVYEGDDGSYTTTVTVDGEEIALSDGMWGCMAYSPIAPLAQGDITMAFEYFLDVAHGFGTPFQAALAEHLSREYMDYVNGLGLVANEATLGIDVNHDGDLDDDVDLTIDYDAERYGNTHGYGGNYLDLYLARFEDSLTWYLDNLAYADDWTWFDAGGAKMTDEAVSAMTAADKAIAFIEGRYAKGASDSGMGPGADAFGGMGVPGDDDFGGGQDHSDDGTATPDEPLVAADSDAVGSEEEGGHEDGDGLSQDNPEEQRIGEGSDDAEGVSQGDAPSAGDGATTPDAGAAQQAAHGVNSANYESYASMVEAYATDIAEIEAGDLYGNNIVALYDPMRYIGANGGDAAVWSRVVMGAAEGDMSLLASFNMGLAWTAAGTDAAVEWQWDGGHVPGEILGESFSYYIDKMYGKHVSGASTIEKPSAEPLAANGTADVPTGANISSWVSYVDGRAHCSLPAIAAYRAAAAVKAIPSFDTIDYSQADYVFGSATKDARHWDAYVLKAFRDHADSLEPLFNLVTYEDSTDNGEGGDGGEQDVDDAMAGEEEFIE